MASYGKYRHTTIKGEKDTDWYVEIHKKDFSGSSTEMTLSGEGFEITWNGQGSTRERIFLGSECVISMFVVLLVLFFSFSTQFPLYYLVSIFFIGGWWK